MLPCSSARTTAPTTKQTLPELQRLRMTVTVTACVCSTLQQHFTARVSCVTLKMNCVSVVVLCLIVSAALQSVVLVLLSVQTSCTDSSSVGSAAPCGAGLILGDSECGGGGASSAGSDPMCLLGTNSAYELWRQQEASEESIRTRVWIWFD